GGEVDRRQRPLLVEAVAAGPPGFGPHRHARLLERADVAFDRPGADLEPAGQPPRAARPRRDSPQFLDKGIQPISPVHATTLRAAYDIPSSPALSCRCGAGSRRIGGVTPLLSPVRPGTP